jgi:hypothetical protein
VRLLVDFLAQCRVPPWEKAKRQDKSAENGKRKTKPA